MGFLIPPWYKTEIPDDLSMNICSIIWGFSLCFSVFTCTEAARQTRRSYKRGKLFNTYIIMVWAEWISSVVISIVSWMVLRGYIPPGFGIYFTILCLWTVQVHCILQIIINRVALLMIMKSRARTLKIVVFFIIAAINISVFCIWLPARLQISERYVHINEIWDRTEKALFAVVDASLNLYFIYTVRTKLIAGGLKKYYAIFKFNLAMIFGSVSMDVVLIGVMSMRSGLVYMQFHPMVYLVKLHIELNMAALIAKIVKASNPLNESSPVQMTSVTTSALNTSMTTTITSNNPSDLYSKHADLGAQILGPPRSMGITKTVEMGMTHHRADRPNEEPLSEELESPKCWRNAEDMV